MCQRQFYASNEILPSVVSVTSLKDWFCDIVIVCLNKLPMCKAKKLCVSASGGFDLSVVQNRRSEGTGRASLCRRVAVFSGPSAYAGRPAKSGEDFNILLIWPDAIRLTWQRCINASDGL